MKLLLRSQIAALHDVFMAGLSFIIALYLRLGDSLLTSYNNLIPSLLAFVAVCVVVFYLMRLYSGIWRFASIPDLVAITKAVTIAILIFLFLHFVIARLEGYPRSVLFINWLLLIALLGAPRMLYRIAKDRAFSLDFSSKENIGYQPIPVILAGISENSVLFLRYVTRRKTPEYQVVAIIDNDTTKINRNIYGIKVFSDIQSVAKTVRKLRRLKIAPQRIIIGDEELGPGCINELFKKAESLGLTLAKLPKVGTLKQHNTDRYLEPVAIEDLLGRAQNQPQLGRRRELIQNKVVLVTGAGGTIGSELSLQICTFDPKQLVLFELSEFNLYQVEHKIKKTYPDIKFEGIIGDVRNFNSLEQVFKDCKPELIFHAAALKHVPIVENNVIEAMATNILGTKNVADLALKYNAKKMVLISTDKAVNPSSFMGATKRAAELYLAHLSHNLGIDNNNNTQFATVRFGNVLGSSGSVIPLFQSQLQAGGPITITDKKMLRFFMTVREAVELVLQASTLEEKINKTESSVFVLDMGEPVKIIDMAEKMIRLAGLRPHQDIEIKEIGARPGEKLSEELFYEFEKKQKTAYKAISMAVATCNNDKKWLEYFTKIQQLVEIRNQSALKQIIKQMIPEYSNN